MRFHFVIVFVLVAEFDTVNSFLLTLTTRVQLLHKEQNKPFSLSSVRKKFYHRDYSIHCRKHTSNFYFQKNWSRVRQMIKTNVDPSMETDKEANNLSKQDDIEKGRDEEEITAPLIESSDVRATVTNSSDCTLAITESSETSDSSVKVASYKELLLFISTTIIIWLSEPLLSLVDTTIVGKFASNLNLASGDYAFNGIVPETIQLAALGPATMLCDNAFYLTYFLAMATTNQLATASAKSDEALQVKTTSHALGVAFTIGLMISIVIFSFGDSLLQFIIGSGGAMVNGVDLTKPIIAFSWDYTKIRGLLAPFTVMGMIAQAVCLATLDTRTPAMAVLAASVINIVGDVVLVAKIGMGLRGAAMATAGAGAISSYILVQEAKKKVDKWKSSLPPEQRRPFISLPDLKSFGALAKLAGPIFFVIVGKLVCYSAMTLKTSDFGMFSLATHNVMLRIFFFFCTFGDSFSLAAQSFLPKVLFGADEEARTMNRDPTHNTTSSSKTGFSLMLRRLFLLASAMAVTNSFVAKNIMEKGGAFFTNDVTILSLLSDPKRVFYMMGSVLLHPFIMTMEGSILAIRDLGFLVGAYGFTMTFMLLLLKFGTSSFTDVWRALFIFQAIRSITFGSRVTYKSRNSPHSESR